MEFFEEKKVIFTSKNDLVRFNNILYFDALEREIEEENREWKRKRKRKNKVK